MSDFIDAINSSAQVKTGTDLYNSDEGAIMGKEDFLLLLVEQLKNQDPLNPDDPTEFTSQLAQFSSLEQLTNLNDSMEQLANSSADSDRLSTLGTIGKLVAFEGDEMPYSGEPLEFGYNLSGPASEVTISLNKDGATLATLSGEGLTQGNHFLTWDGLTEDGSIAPIGDYDIVISAQSASGEAVGTTTLIKSEVTGVDLSASATGTLITKAGEVPFTNIIGVFEPESSIVASNKVSDAEEDDEESDKESIPVEINNAADDLKETKDAITNAIT
jgi:flagellar basal-body rod modification protein FlgD